MREPILAIKTNTWHYKYFKFIRGLWGLDVPLKTSLCPYCQTMFWFSLAAIIASPLIILGWLLTKFIRVAYKSCARLGLNFMVDFMDKVGLGDAVEFVTKKSEKEPLPATMLFGFMALLCVAALVILIGAVLFSIGFLIANVGEAPGALLRLLTGIGWALFKVFAFFGFLLHQVWHGLHWFFTNGALWSEVASWLLWGLEWGLGACVTCFLLYKLSETRLGRWVISSVELRLNGFGEARAEAKKRRDEEAEKKRLAEEANPKPQVEKKPCIVVRALKRFWGGLFNQTVRVGKTAGVALGVFGIIWEFIKAVKRNACPIVDFVQEEQPSTPPPQPEKPPESDPPIAVN
jgi:hypothetical protein